MSAPSAMFFCGRETTWRDQSKSSWEDPLNGVAGNIYRKPMVVARRYQGFNFPLNQRGDGMLYALVSNDHDQEKMK